MSDLPEEPAGPEADGDLDSLLSFVRERRNFDFTGYKRPSLTRRFQKRMQAVGAETYGDYISVLESEPGEFTELFDTILINVTAFLRDPEAWEFLRTRVVPEIAQRAEDEHRELRVWSAGCATGQEAYSLAVLIAEHVGADRFRDRVKIYATDADEGALVEARQGRYQFGVLVDAFGEDLTTRYFEPRDGAYAFCNDLRRSVIFGRHDLVQDPPISRIDLLVCRNTLMYFNADTQRRVLANLHYALNDTGYLFLGKSEALVTRTNLFSTVDLRRHIFVKHTRGVGARPPLPAPPSATSSLLIRRVAGDLVEAAFESGTTAQLAIDPDGVLVAANALARSLFGIRPNHIGRPLRDCEVSYRPVELRGPIDEVLTQRRPITLAEVEHRTGNSTLHRLDVVIQTVERAGTVLGATVTFVDVTRFRTLFDDLARSERELEVAHEELQSAVEELETTNEELQSTNEELETTNEELHSTNEELETMNEELQSTNEELETVNLELRRRTEDLDNANNFLRAILFGLDAGVVVLSPEMAVRAWNRQAEELWGLRADEVEGAHFLNLDIGLPLDRLRAPIRAALAPDASPERVRLEAVNRRGRKIELSVTLTPLAGDGDAGGVILAMDGSAIGLDGDGSGR